MAVVKYTLAKNEGNLYHHLATSNQLHYKKLELQIIRLMAVRLSRNWLVPYAALGGTFLIVLK